jgi:hypothetical protein
MSFAVTTHSYDNARSGSNTRETILTPAAVKERGIRHLFSLKLPGDARGCEAQPLIVPGVRMKDGTVHDVVYVATMANRVFAFDANNGAELWMVQLATPIEDSEDIDARRLNDHWGILSTPVIDPHATLMYVCAWTSVTGSLNNAQHSLHAIRLQDGCDAHPPVRFDAVTHDPGHGRPVHHFHSAALSQRAALLLTDNAIFVAFGRIDENAKPERGWLIAVDVATFFVSAAWVSTSEGSGGGISQSGAGPAADPEGHIYVQTGNGDFDGITDFGESIVKLKYTPPRDAGPGKLTAIDWWTPWTDAARGRREAGPAGPVLALANGAVLVSNSDGLLFTADMHALGGTQAADLEPAHAASNYAKLKTSPIFYTYYPGAHPSPHPADASQLNAMFADRTRRLHGTPVLWHGAAQGLTHFCWGENGNLRAWTLSPAGVSVYLGCSAEWASAEAPAPPGGMPGGMISLSAKGDEDGIVWASIPYGDSNQKLSAGRFLAYDAASASIPMVTGQCPRYGTVRIGTGSSLTIASIGPSFGTAMSIFRPTTARSGYWDWRERG